MSFIKCWYLDIIFLIRIKYYYCSRDLDTKKIYIVWVYATSVEPPSHNIPKCTILDHQICALGGPHIQYITTTKLPICSGYHDKLLTRDSNSKNTSRTHLLTKMIPVCDVGGLGSWLALAQGWAVWSKPTWHLRLEIQYHEHHTIHFSFTPPYSVIIIIFHNDHFFSLRMPWPSFPNGSLPSRPNTKENININW